MKKETLLRAMTDIDDFLIEEAAPKGYLPKEKHGFSWLNSKILAGAIAVLMLAVMLPMVLRPGNDSSQKPPVQLVNPFTACETMQEAESITGFILESPETYSDWTLSRIGVYTGTMIETVYTDSTGEAVMRIRKAEGSDDISGDYNSYSFETEIEADGKTVTAKGENDLCSLITWTDQGFSYAVSLEEPLSTEEAAALVSSIH